MRFFALIVILNFFIQGKAQSFNDCHFPGPISSEDELQSIANLSIQISETNASSEALAVKIPGAEEELIKVVVTEDFYLPKNINLDRLVRDQNFLKKAFGKGVNLQRSSDTHFLANRSILGVEIEFSLDLSSVSDTQLVLEAKDYSHVFRNSLIKLSSKKVAEGQYLISISGTSFIKKSSYEKLNSVTFGNGKGFIKSQIQNQVSLIKKLLMES